MHHNFTKPSQSQRLVQRIPSAIETLLDIGWALLWFNREKRCLFFTKLYIEFLTKMVVEREAGRLEGRSLEHAERFVSFMSKRMDGWIAEFGSQRVTH
jgi:hypothetical protein